MSRTRMPGSATGRWFAAVVVAAVAAFIALPALSASAALLATYMATVSPSTGPRR